MVTKKQVLILILCGLPSLAQTETRRATLRDSRGDGGKCTIDVVVDTAAEVEIRGDEARLRTLAGQPSTWRRFECSDPLPPDPADFKFTGVDGRGRQTLIADPRQNRGVAVVRIEDPDGGREGYTFDIEWRGRSDRGERVPRGPEPDNRPRAVGPSLAISACREAVRERARELHGVREVEFTRIDADDNPGRRDWVIGSITEHRGPIAEEFHFQCGVDLQSGRVRSVDLRRGTEERGRGRRIAADEALRICRDAVSDRITSQGYERINIYDIRADDQPGRNDWVVGQATGQRESRGQNFGFSCSVDFGSGRVRSVEVNPR